MKKLADETCHTTLKSVLSQERELDTTTVYHTEEIVIIEKIVLLNFYNGYSSFIY
jgi:hypothetical protein